MAFDARGIRKLRAIWYRYKCQMTTIYLMDMALVSYLVIVDVTPFFTK
ncbi:MAG: hypothetical protein M0019_00395 [Actinomycetota bacterium]|nr:hypothetical protein [Actinomycetota bacterium]